MTEIIWKNINNYENYSVSNMGTIKNNTTNRILKYFIRNGYPSITLCKDNNKKHLIFILSLRVIFLKNQKVCSLLITKTKIKQIAV